MKFGKAALTFEQQADLMLSRGMVGDRDLMIKRLAAINYYRLSGYSFTFKRAPDQEPFKAGTKFDFVWERYVFDRKLRLLVMDAMERIEVTIRTLTSYHHALQFGPFGYVELPSSLPRLQQAQWEKFRDEVRADVAKGSKETFVEHFRRKYGDLHQDLPLWAASELLTFRNTLYILNNSPNTVKNKVAGAFGVPPEILESWMRTLNTVRNICAHHGRLWNREFGVSPKVPSAWASLLPRGTQTRKLFLVLTIINASIRKISPGTRWCHRLVGLLDAYSGIPRVSMGFPDNWKDCRLWDNLKETPAALSVTLATEDESSTAPPLASR